MPLLVSVAVFVNAIGGTVCMRFGEGGGGGGSCACVSGSSSSGTVMDSDSCDGGGGVVCTVGVALA